MIGFGVSAVRGIIFAVAVYIGIGTPPIIISQTKQFISQCGVPSSDLSAFAEALPSDFSLSLEWTLFKPNGGFCPAKNPLPLITESLLDEPNSTQPFDQPSFDEDQLSIQHVAHLLYGNKDICPREDISTPAICYNDSLIAVHVTPGHLDLVISLSSNLDTDNEQQLFSDDDDPKTPQDFEVCSQIPTMNLCPVDLFDETNHSTSLSTDSEYQPLPGSDSGVLWYHEQLRANLRNAILSSLPETWAKWITSNRPTLGIICVTVMCISLLWPLLFVLLKQVNAKRRMIGELKWADAENRNLKEKVFLLEKESKKSSNQLREMKMKMEGITGYFHSIEDNLQRKLIVSERKLQRYELLEFEAQEKFILVEEKVEKERKEYLDSKRRLRAYIKTLQNQVQVNMNRADKAVRCIQFTEQQLRLANKTITEIMILRRSEGKTKKSVSFKLDDNKISTATDISCSPSSTAAKSATHDTQDSKLVPQCDIEVSKAKEDSHKAQDEESGVVTFAPKRTAEFKEAVPIDHEDTESWSWI